MILCRPVGEHLQRTGLCTLIILLSGILNAQTKHEFEALSIDRPDVSNLPTTVRQGHYQVELGMEFSQGQSSKEYSLPNLVLRTGLGKKVELRLGVNHQKIDSSEYFSDAEGVTTTLSLKYRFLEENGLVPSIAIQPDINFQFSDSDPIGHEPTYALFLLFNNTLHQKIFINYNAGLIFNNNSTEVLLSTSFSFLHTHRLGYFVEVFNIDEHINLRQISIDAGITYLLKPRLQIDLYFARQLVEKTPRYCVGFGVGFRLDRLDLQQKSFKETGIHH